jgi:trehalose 6-phosphate phosphatase
LTLRHAIELLFQRRPVVVGVDFDGTLAPIVDHPDDVVPHQRALAHLRSIAGRPGITVAVVSGRGLEDLRQCLGEVPGATLIGEHGNDTGEQVPPSPVLEETTRLVEALVADIPGASCELKQRSVAFHYRNVESGAETRALRRLRVWAEERPTLSLLEGKEVLEMSVASRSKGDAITDLAGSDAGIVYIGDDTTDESVFAVLTEGDVGIKVGPGETLAGYRVADVAEVVEVLGVIDLISS